MFFAIIKENMLLTWHFQQRVATQLVLREPAQPGAGAEGVGVAPGEGEFAALGGLGGVDAAEAVLAEHLAGAVRVVAQDKRAAVGREERVLVEERPLVHPQRGGERRAVALAQPHEPAGKAATRTASAAAESR